MKRNPPKLINDEVLVGVYQGLLNGDVPDHVAHTLVIGDVVEVTVQIWIETEIVEGIGIEMGREIEVEIEQGIVVGIDIEVAV